ncbi:hypothetical protein [uncultured Bacteroides sp.]|uniref:hypothetical protein n=1 Tax=uncultured Bacteroides sp. TaxID=162156 RepID=UPI002AAB12CE|nr:hypothetical protein [uncultured Bacteroides sp.]
MKLYLRRQAIIAWILLFTITPMGIVKSFHTHESKEVCATHHCNDSSCNCAICQFHLLPFVKPTTFYLNVHFVAQTRDVAERIFKVIKINPCSYSLRAPPYLF